MGTKIRPDYRVRLNLRFAEMAQSEGRLRRNLIPHAVVMSLDRIVPHEEVQISHARDLLERMRAQGVFTTPTPVGRVSTNNGLMIDGNHRLFALREGEMKFAPTLLFDYHKDDRLELGTWIRRRALCEGVTAEAVTAYLLERNFQRIQDAYLTHEMIGKINDLASLAFLAHDGGVEAFIHLAGNPNKGPKSRQRLQEYVLLDALTSAFGCNENQFTFPNATSMISNGNEGAPSITSALEDGMMEIVPIRLKKSDVVNTFSLQRVFGTRKLVMGQVAVFPKKSTRYTVPLRTFGLPFEFELLSGRTGGLTGADELTSRMRFLLLSERVIKVTQEQTRRLFMHHREDGSPGWRQIVGSFDRKQGYIEDAYLVLPDINSLSVEELRALAEIFCEDSASTPKTPPPAAAGV